MPSNYTPNYKLNQWEADDRVLRTDFNADNVKIDAALETLAAKGHTVQLRAIPSISHGLSSSVLGLTGTPWSNLETYTIVLRFPTDFQDEDQLLVALTGNDGTHYNIATFPPESCAVVLWPRHDAARKVSGLLICKSPMLFNLDLTYQEINQFYLEGVPNGISVSPAMTFYGTP